MRESPEQLDHSAPAQESAGLIAEYDSVENLLAAAEQVKESGLTRWDAHTPFPVHGLPEAMGLRPTVLPWIVFFAGLVGCAGGLLLQYWTNAVDYPHIISGKPFFSLPANIPVTFELTILLSAIAAFVGVILLNRLPRLSHPLFLSKRFRRVTDDRFFIAIDRADPRFDEKKTATLLEEAGAVTVESCPVDTSAPRVPRPVLLGVVVLLTLAIVPPVIIARSYFGPSETTGLHLIDDMDDQNRYDAQERSSFFADGRATRGAVAGAVARGRVGGGPAYDDGRVGEEWVQRVPIDVDIGTLRRGQKRFEIYCVPCHGVAGVGDGPVATRAEELQQGLWVPPASLHVDAVRSQPDGQLFNTITHGIRSMPAYGAQIPPADRWAIVTYVRALQRSRAARVEDVPEEQRAAIK